MVNLTRVLLRSTKKMKYWERYVNNEMFGGYVVKRTLAGPVVMNYNLIYKFSEHRPWTEEAKRINAAGKRWKRDYIEPIKEWTILLGDRVEVLVGPDKGKQGFVGMTVKERNWVYVEGLNCEYKVIKPHPDLLGMMSKVETPLTLPHEVKLVDPSDNKVTDAEWRYTEEGDLVRVSLRTGRILPFSHRAKQLDDYVNPADYKEQVKDTDKNEVTKVTFKPALKSTQQELMDHFGIKEERKKTELYWY
ncbi:large ribosomal subunit protein uL24m-like [Tubulanus polymorphus]|uniref:large ribosomal subunit protein uL24m-like n=1 Tax=Tubulanus polymorphus TaxID=672921 RepID=UPI003DA2A54F